MRVGPVTFDMKFEQRGAPRLTPQTPKVFAEEASRLVEDTVNERVSKLVSAVRERLGRLAPPSGVSAELMAEYIDSIGFWREEDTVKFGIVPGARQEIRDLADHIEYGDALTAPVPIWRTAIREILGAAHSDDSERRENELKDRIAKRTG